tara:strand:- start:1492 stop:1692 length:201 start_codon:yes stop_codon:yes gene_type:complete
MLELKQIAKEMQIGDSVFFKEKKYQKNNKLNSTILIKFLQDIKKESLKQKLVENNIFKGHRVWCIK